MHMVAGMLALLVCVGCATQSGTTRTRAANDLGCPEEQIEVQHMGGGAHRAVGCGGYVEYVCITDMHGPGHPVTCVRERGPLPLPGAPPPMAAPGPPPPPPAQMAPPLGCNPPCSPGYGCQGTTCIALCNPPCAPGSACAPDRTCQPLPPAPGGPAPPPPGPAAGP